MKMKELSALTGISDRTIRYYIDDGLFIPERYTENYEGRKSYNFSENDVKRLKHIALLRKYGFSINEIKELTKGTSDLKSLVDKRVAEAKQSSEAQLDEIRTLEAISAKQPNDVDELCEMLSNPVVNQEPIPSIDEQSAYKPMYKKIKSNNKKLIVIVIITIIFSSILTIKVIKDFSRATDNRNQSVLNYVGIEDRKELGKYTTIFNDSVMYNYVLELPGLDLSIQDVYIPLAQSALFPKRIDDKNVEDFYCEYYETAPLGEGCQFWLEIKYDENSFTDEINRISKIEGSRIRFDKENFSLPAYVTVYGCANDYEYALIKENELSIVYIYIQSVKKENLKLNSSYLPKYYNGYGDAGDKACNIYASHENDGTLALVDNLSSFNSFEIKKGQVCFYCTVTVQNNSSKSQSFRINGVFDDDCTYDDKGNCIGLIKEWSLYANEQNNENIRVFELLPNEEKTFEICFVGTHTGLKNEKQTRLLPELRFELFE